MLDIIRNLVSSIFGKILLGVMVLSFALWGVGDILTSGNNQLAAKVGNQKITLNEFYYNFQNALSNFNASLDRQITIAEAHQENIDKLVINELVYDKMVLEFAEINNIYIGENILKGLIKSQSQFLNEDGTFNKIKYQYSIQNNFSSEEEFLDKIKMIYLKDLLFKNFDISETIDKRIIDTLYSFEGEERNIEYFILSDKSYSENKIIQIDIENYFNENIENYRIEKSLSANLIEIKYSDFKKDFNLNNEILINYYNENINLYTDPQKSNIELVRFGTYENASDFKKIYESGDEKRINIFLDNKNISINRIEDLEYGDYDQAISTQILKLNKNQISDPVEVVNLGYYIIKLISKTEETITPFDEVKNSINDLIISDEAYSLFDETINFADNLNSEGYNLNDIANEIGLNLTKEVGIEYIEKIINDKEVLSKILNYEVGAQTELILNDENGIIIEVVKISDSHLPKYNEVNELVLLDYKRLLKNNYLENLLSDTIIEIKSKGLEYFYKFSKDNDIEIVKLNNIKRFDKITFLNDGEINKMFEISKDALLRFNKNDQYGILLLTDIITPKKTESDFYKNIVNNINNNFNVSLKNNLESEIINNIDYEIFFQNIDNIF
mgnify:CR=1 FL=1